MKRNRLISTVLVAVAAVTLSLGGATTAQAAVGYCTTTKTVAGYGLTAVVPATAGGNRDCLMSQGAVGNHVWFLQVALNTCYGRGLVVDGVWGPATTTALKWAQGWHGLTQDGVYGSQTNHKILWRANTGVCNHFPAAW